MGNEVLFYDNDDRLHREKVLFYQKNAGFTVTYKGCKTLLNKQDYTISIPSKLYYTNSILLYTYNFKISNNIPNQIH